MGVIYKNGVKYGGFCSSVAMDTDCDTTGTVFASTNVQGVIEEISDLVNGVGDGKYPLSNICVGVNPTTGHKALVVSWNDGATDKVNYIDFTN